MFNVKGKDVLVLGLGASGYSSCELLIRNGAKVRISESSEHESICQRINLLGPCLAGYETGGHTPLFCSKAEIVVISPGIDPEPLYLKGILGKKSLVISELELGYLFCPAPIIAITGTNGKSTTTKLIGHILDVFGRHTVVCGNIGNPLTGEVGKMTEQSIAVVEVSSFQLEAIRAFNPYIAILLNVSEDHYERHGDYEGYKNEKFKIFQNQTSSEWAVLNAEFQRDKRAGEIKGQTVFWGDEQTSAFVCDGKIFSNMHKKKTTVMSVKDIPVKGNHNLENILASIVAAKIMGVDDEIIREGIIGFKALKHRFEKIADFKGIEIFDDSKATNIDAASRALEFVNKKAILIAGGRDKGGDYSLILPLALEKVKTMVLIGEAADKIEKVFSSIVPCLKAKDMAEAVRIGFNEAGEGDCLLLSPMCSSFDMYTSYKERGEAFRREVFSCIEDNQ
ncbi:MAG: UDP-N-acetylmuramoyl-L-alanine--D-glutamate ligase [Candidatus Omnitrophota bacterium]